MKSFRLLGTSAFAFLLISCGQTATEGYRINGKITNPKYDERTVYMVDAAGHKCDSATVKDCKFTFEGKHDATKVMELVVHENDSDMFPVTLPVVLEKGDITVEMGDMVYVADTEENDRMMNFLMEKDKFVDGMYGKSLSADSVKSEFATFIVQQVLKNGNSTVGKYIFNSYKSKLDGNQIEECNKIIK